MKIKDIVTFVSRSITPQEGVTYNLYSLPSFDDGKTFEVLDGADIQSNKYDVPNKCVLFNKLNVRFKRVWRIDSQDENKIASTEFLPLVVDEDVVDFQYCYYLLISDKITNYLCGQNTNTSGSHKRIDPDNFLNIEIKLPKMSIQRQIGKTLSALDCKIVLNKQINDNLEATAKQLYDYWFVQFDFPNEEGKPYKSSGGAMVWNEKQKREIPQGLGTPKQILQTFHNKVAPIFDSIKNNIEEINSLTKQRNELLPLLMNGQATVNYHLSDD
ncbi:MAG: restriction endonuclease subunit S [Prevotella sp.]|nr:restriction endonuclease subunit S [Prevotella sp.]